MPGMEGKGRGVNELFVAWPVAQKDWSRRLKCSRRSAFSWLVMHSSGLGVYWGRVLKQCESEAIHIRSHNPWSKAHVTDVAAAVLKDICLVCGEIDGQQI